MTLDFGDSIRVGTVDGLIGPEGLVRHPGTKRSSAPRGLALKSLSVSNRWDGLWNFFGLKEQIYFLSVAFDLSGRPPMIMPPKVVPKDLCYPVHHGQKIEFLGLGTPIFPAKHPIEGGLIVYITVCEADKGIQHAGKVMAKVHEDLGKDDSLVKVISKFVKDPTKTAIDAVLGAAVAALQPIATILKSNGDDYLALFSGMYPATGSWEELLSETQHDTTIELVET